MTKIGQVASMLGVTLNTLKNWQDRYPDYFSKSALGQGVSQRVFTESDILTAATIAKLRADKLDFDAIGEQLEDGYRVDSPQVANFGVDMRMVPAAAVEQILDSTEIKTALAQVTAERDKLLELLEKSDEEKRELYARVEALQDQIGELRERAARAEGRLEEKDKRRRWFG